MVAMIRIVLSEIPKYLHSSAFYKSLNLECASDEILIPADCFKRDCAISSMEDFSVLLNVSLFWQLEETLPCLIDFCCANPTLAIEMERAVNNLTESELQKDLSCLLKGSKTRIICCSLLAAMLHNRTELAHNLIGSSIVKGDKGYTALAARLGRTDYLRSMWKSQYPIDRSTLDAAAEGGSVDCVKFVHSILGVDKHENMHNMLSLVARLGHEEHHLHVDELLIPQLVKNGTYFGYKCKQYLVERGC